MMISGLMLESSGLGCLRIPKLPISNHRFNGTRFIGSNSVRIAAGRISGTWIRHFLGRHTLIKCATSSGRSYQEPSFDDYRPEPYWLTLTKEAYWALKSLFVFLAEQPGQLRYIEWPSFQGTLKTATLTLVLVALLIIALSSVDSALCYLLALLLRKPA